MSDNINSIDWSRNAISLTKSPLTKFYRNFLIKKLDFFNIELMTVTEKDNTMLFNVNYYEPLDN